MINPTKNKIVSGVIWSSIERFSSQMVQFIISILIARLLLPSDYGLIAMLGIFLAIAQTFVDSGFSNALIQKKDKTEVDYSTVFFLNIVISIGAYLILYFLAPLIAFFYKTPELDLLTKVISLNVVITAFGVVQRTRLTILLNFKLQTIISLFSTITSGIIAIYMAYKDMGVWALVTQSIINSLLNNILLWWFSSWKPKFCFSKDSFKAMFGFGYKLLLSGLLHTLYTNLYTLVIGKKFSSVDAGLFNRAFSFSQLPSVNITLTINRAIYPVLCNMQEDDEKLRISFLAYLRMSCFIIFPLMITICMLAKPLVIFLLTEKWEPMIPLLQLLCIAYMWYPISIANNQVVNAKGRSDYFLKAEIIKKIFAFIILFVTMPFGLYWLSGGLIIYSIIDIYIISRYLRNIIRVNFWDQFREILPILMLVASLAIVLYFSLSFFENILVQLILCTFIGITYFIMVCLIFRIKEFHLIKDMIIRIVKNSSF